MTPENTDTPLMVDCPSASGSPFAVCWTNNMRGASNDELYIMHAVLNGPRTLCGCRIQEVGEDVDDEHRVGCKRCLRIMENADVCQPEGEEKA